MTQFDNLKSNYALTIQLGLGGNIGYQSATAWNESLHKFCENLVESSCYSDAQKAAMKAELELLKEVLSKEIDCHYRRG